MDHFAGLDVSVKESSICIVDDTGNIAREVKVASGPDALLAVLTNPAYCFQRIGWKLDRCRDADSRIQFSDEFDGDGATLFSACAERALEGSKHALAPYRSGRSKTWLKTKCFMCTVSKLS